jgi:hypothetical protein
LNKCCFQLISKNRRDILAVEWLYKNCSAKITGFPIDNELAVSAKFKDFPISHGHRHHCLGVHLATVSVLRYSGLLKVRDITIPLALDSDATLWGQACYFLPVVPERESVVQCPLSTVHCPKSSRFL